MNRTFVIFLVYLLLQFVIITIFTLTLPAVREVSPLNFELFEAELTLYPDRVDANFVLQGIEEGLTCRLGCDKPATLKSARRNKLSTYQHSSAIDAVTKNCCMTWNIREHANLVLNLRAY